MTISTANQKVRSLGIAILSLAILFPGGGQAQTTFTEITPSNNVMFNNAADEDFWISSLAPADVDSDGDTDLAVFGYYVLYNVDVLHRLVILKNDGADANGNWVFTPTDVPLGDLYAGGSDLAWGDFDGDNDPDLAVGSEGLMVIYRNSGGTLQALPNVLPAYYEFSGSLGFDLNTLSWADVDNDGDLDLLVPNSFNLDTFEFQTDLVRNDGANQAGGWNFATVPYFVTATTSGHSRWADEDADGDLDLFLVNVGAGEGFINRYSNTQGQLSLLQTLGIEVAHGNADWGDYDGDGDMDIIASGNVLDVNGTYSTVLRVYTNSGTGQYSSQELLPSPDDDWLDIHTATWADYDSDGDMDLLVTGNHVDQTVSQIVGKSRVFINNANSFSMLDLLLPAPYDSLGRTGAITWLDIDNDGDLDYLVTGAYYMPNDSQVESQMHLYRNDAINENVPPSSPGNLRSSISNGSVALAWTTAIDDTTPADALTYELNIQSVQATNPSAGSRLPEPGLSGNTGKWRISNLTNGSYIWQIKAVDSAFNSSLPAKGLFRIGPPRVKLVACRVSPPEVSKNLKYRLTLTNLTNQSQKFQMWVETYDNDGRKLDVSPLKDAKLNAKQKIERSLTYHIPKDWEEGRYRTRVCAGVYPDLVEYSSQFKWRLER